VSDQLALDQISDLPALSPTSSLDDLRDFLLRLQQWHRTREPVASGFSPYKFVTKADLVNLGLVSLDAGLAGDLFSVNDTLFKTPVETLNISATGSKFTFANPAATTSTSPTVVFTANLENTTGNVTWTAAAYDGDNNPLGAAVLSSVTTGSAELTSTDFVGGLGIQVRYVRVTATLGILSSSVLVYRVDTGDDSLLIDMSKQAHVVTALPDGSGGDYSTAFTDLRMLRNGTDETNQWDWSIVANGCTATVNGEAGPITGEANITVAVSAMDEDTASVQITASNGVDPDLVCVFTLTRSSVGITSGLVVVEDATATTVDLQIGKLTICTDAAAVTAKLPPNPPRSALCGAYFSNALLTNVVSRNGNKLNEGTSNYTVNPRGVVLVYIFLGATHGWLRI
jgi:hypothetical protein